MYISLLYYCAKNQISRNKTFGEILSHVNDAIYSNNLISMQKLEKCEIFRGVF